MISINLILAMLFCHWLSDFVAQTEWQATNKSKNNLALLAHTITYTLVMAGTLIPLGLAYLMFGLGEREELLFNTNPMWFFPITFVCHTVTDYVTSRINANLWKEKKIHEFFVSVGFDQFLHFSQLFLTYWLLTK